MLPVPPLKKRIGVPEMELKAKLTIGVPEIEPKFANIGLDQFVKCGFRVKLKMNVCQCHWPLLVFSIRQDSAGAEGLVYPADSRLDLHVV